MNTRIKKSFMLLLATCMLAVLMLGTGYDAAWASSPPGNEIWLVNISQLTVNSASAFHRVVVSRVDPNLVAIAWREYGLPINTNAGAGPGERTADCHVSVSTDGGNTFHDTNLMPMLRQNTGDPELPTEPAPGLYYCNAPWVAIGDDRTIYAGGSVFTPLGDRNWYPARGTDAPKQGRALVTVSTDDGQSWGPPTFGIRISNFAPGVTGLGCSNNLPCIKSPPGTDQWHTPWDGAMAVTAPRSMTFYSKAGSHVAASDDRAQTFGLVHTINVPGWTFSNGMIAASGDMLVVSFIASVTPLGATCPCLGVATSTDKGATWSAQLIAEASKFNSSGSGDTAHYPFAASDPNDPSHYAVAAYTPDHTSMQVFWTEDDGDTWNRAAVGPVPVAGTVARAGKIAVGYTSDGKILAVWRAFYAPDNPNVAGGPGWFDTFAALLHGNGFSPTIRVSPQSSRYPTRTTVGPTGPNVASYNLNNGGGDFSTFITGNDQFAFVGFPYAPGDPDESALDTYLAKIPLTMMNNAPVLADIPNYAVNEGQLLSFTISGTDPDGDSLTYSAAGLPAGAHFDSVSRTFSWTPDILPGSYPITFNVTDGIATVSKTTTITVNAPASALTGMIASKSGPQNARLWTITVTNNGPGKAYSSRINGFKLTQTYGAACTPLVATSFPLPLGDIVNGGSANGNIVIDFTGCANTARFSLNVPFSANNGASTGTIIRNNEYR